MNRLFINKITKKLIYIFWICLIIMLWYIINIFLHHKEIQKKNEIEFKIQEQLKILNLKRKKLTQVTNFSYQDENWNIYIRKDWKDLEWYTCESTVWKEYLQVVWWNKFWDWNSCIFLKESSFITIQEAQKRIEDSKRIIWKFKIDKIDEKIENFKDKTFNIAWKNIFLWDISLDNHFYLFEKWDFIAKLYVLLFFQINAKVVVLEENSWEKMVVYAIKDNYEQYISYLKNRSKQILETAKKRNILLKTNSKKEKLLAQVYETMINNIDYCFECTDEWNSDIYEWMNWILTMKNKKWVCDWIVKSIIYVMEEWWYKIKKETWLWCSEKWCENHSWFVSNYSKTKKDWTKYQIKKYYDPTWDLQTEKEKHKLKLDTYNNETVLGYNEKKLNLQFIKKSYFWLSWKEFYKTHKKDIFQR